MANKTVAVILLSFVLAVGFLLIILSCALWANWLPLLVGPCPFYTLNNVCLLIIPPALIFVLAPLPNALFSRWGADDFAADYSSSAVDFGRFVTACTVVTGFALPLVLAHAEVIHQGACIMSSIGGALVFSYNCICSSLHCLTNAQNRCTAR